MRTHTACPDCRNYPRRGQRTCLKCGELKSADMFYARPEGRDGLRKECKECFKAASAATYHRKIRDVSWKLAERQRNRQRTRMDRAAGRKPPDNESSRASHKLYYVRYPERKLAHAKTNAAVKAMKLARQPCEECGAQKTDAHHDDYSKPLDVRWLCRLCHAAHHIKLREAELLNQAV